MLPIPTVNRNQGRIQETTAEWTAAHQALDRKRLQLYNELAEVFALYATALNQVTNYRDNILPKAAENLDLARRGYEAGEFDFVQVLTVQRTFAEKNSIYLDSLGRMWASKLAIDGLLLRDSLADAE
jgi:cobalt-zinc-cadmium efflux system outer membrane protein